MKCPNVKWITMNPVPDNDIQKDLVEEFNKRLIGYRVKHKSTFLPSKSGVKYIDDDLAIRMLGNIIHELYELKE